MTSIPLKPCSTCKQYLPATNEYFHTRNLSPDKLAYICKACQKIKGKQYRANNKDKVAIDKRTWYRNKRRKQGKQIHPPRYKDGLRICRNCETYYPPNTDYFYPGKREPGENRDGLSSYCRKCRQELSIDWARRNGERNRERVRNWAKDNPERASAQSRRGTMKRRNRLINAGTPPTSKQIQALYESSDDYCQYCGIRLLGEYHLEHIQPLARGGTNALDNLAVVCPPCNLQKGDKTFDEWQAMRGW